LQSLQTMLTMLRKAQNNWKNTSSVPENNSIQMLRSFSIKTRIICFTGKTQLKA
jgi:hypothetical protein